MKRPCVSHFPQVWTFRPRTVGYSFGIFLWVLLMGTSLGIETDRSDLSFPVGRPIVSGRSEVSESVGLSFSIGLSELPELIGLESVAYRSARSAWTMKRRPRPVIAEATMPLSASPLTALLVAPRLAGISLASSSNFVQQRPAASARPHRTTRANFSDQVMVEAILARIQEHVR